MDYGPVGGRSPPYGLREANACGKWGLSLFSPILQTARVRIKWDTFEDGAGKKGPRGESEPRSARKG